MEDYWSACRRYEEISLLVRDFIKNNKNDTSLFSIKIFEDYSYRNVEYYLTIEGAESLTQLISGSLLEGEFFAGQALYRCDEVAVGQIRPTFLAPHLCTGSQKFWLHNNLFEIVEIVENKRGNNLITGRDLSSGKMKNYISARDFVCDCIYFESFSISHGGEADDPDDIGTYLGG